MTSAIAAFLVVIYGAAPHASARDEFGSINTQDDRPEVRVDATVSGGEASVTDSGATSASRENDPTAQRERLPFRATNTVCGTIAGLGTAMPALVDACDELANLDCEDGQMPVGSAYEYIATNTLTRPDDVPDARQTAEAFCAVDAQDLADAARKQFRTMRIEPSPVTAKPDAEWTVINIHNPVNTTDVPRTRDVTLLGIDVQIRAVPTRFTWTFGDGTAPLVTGDPGREWTPAHGDPDQTWIGHTYTDPGTYTVELTTTWHGQFRIAGTPTWTDIPGQAQTTTPGPTWQALEMRSVLVDGTGE